MKKKYMYGAIIIALFLTFGTSIEHSNIVFARQNVQYIYDSYGRVITASYPNGITIKYEYDPSGNIISINKSTNGNTTEATTTEDSTTENSTRRDSTTEKSTEYTKSDSNSISVTVTPSVTSNHVTSSELAKYNAFKKKKPVIKSVKEIKKKKKRYLRVQIKRLTGCEKETGYEIQYSVKSNFKKVKKSKVLKAMKSVTKKEIKVSKNTYYVRVRAYLKTRTGKTIYTKYSKTKKIKVK